jgi:cytochrome b pre-mRNA-processing protein 3
LTSKSPGRNAAETLYGEIVSAARAPEFYRDLGVPDTVEGRFEMVALHLVLVVDRLGQEGPSGANLARHLNETCITDLDDNMREIGIGDLSVPRKVKKAAAALFDRHRDLLTAIADENTETLQALLQRDIGQLPASKNVASKNVASNNVGVTSGGATHVNIDALARHVLKLHALVAAAPTDSLLDGQISMTLPVTL